MAELTPRQRRFVEEYLIDLNATQAATRAGYSPKTASEQASRLLSNVNIQAELTAAMQKRSERTNVTADRVLEELALVAFADMGNYVTITASGGVELDLSALPPGALRVVSEITQDEYKDGSGDNARDVKRTKFKLHNKLNALELTGKHLGMFIERSEVGKPGAFANLTDAQKREKAATLLKRALRLKADDGVAGHA